MKRVRIRGARLAGAVALLEALSTGCLGSAPAQPAAFELAPAVSPQAEGRAHLEKGLLLMDGGYYEEACSYLNESDSVWPDPNTLLQLARCHAKRDIWVAIWTYDRLLLRLSTEPEWQRATAIRESALAERTAAIERLHPSRRKAMEERGELRPVPVAPAGSWWPELSTMVPSQADGARDAAVIVAIESYAFLPPIAGAFANGRDWFEYLTRSRRVPLERVRFLSNAEATDFAIARAVAEASAAAQAGGRVWFVFIGHGAPKRGTGDGLLVAADAQQTVDGLENRSLSQREVLSRLMKSAATPVVIVDACFSGRTQDGGALIAGLQPSSVVQPSAPDGAVLLTAATSDQYAGPLPGTDRPAFSYLALGALRGWADADQNGDVTAQEIADYSRSVFVPLLAGRRAQTPQVFGRRSLALARAAEPGPDLGGLLLGLKSLGAAARPAPRTHPVAEELRRPPFDRPRTARALQNAAGRAAALCGVVHGPKGSGKVRLRLGGYGNVVFVTFLTPGFEQTITGDCIRDVFRRAPGIPPFQGTSIYVDQSFEIPQSK